MRRVRNASSVVSQSTATTPRAVAATKNGPHGPGIERKIAAGSVIDGVSHSGHGDILLGSMNDHVTTAEMTLPIEGMTCASCVNRIEQFLRKTPGVETATVNLATEMATIRYLPDVADRGALVGAIESAGYDVRDRPDAVIGAPPRSLADEVSADDLEREREARSLLITAATSIAVAIGIMVVMFGPGTALDMTQVNRLVLLPATFIQVWAGRRFYRPAWRAARHGTANMDTLVAVGTTAAFGYSVVVALWPQVVMDAGIEPVTYFDSSTIVIGLVLLGRWLEARARGPDGRCDPAPRRSRTEDGPSRRRR